MKQDPRQPRAGAGTVVATLLLGSLGVACDPGELPCYEREWQATCDQAGLRNGAGGNVPVAPPPGAAPTAPPAATGISAATPVADCTMWPTLGDMDKFFAGRCGASAGCHQSSFDMVWTDMQSKDIWNRLRDRPARSACNMTKMIDTQNWRNSMIWLKTQQQAAPVCPSGGSPGSTMPPGGMATALSAVESKCLENFLKAIAGK